MGVIQDLAGFSRRFPLTGFRLKVIFFKPTHTTQSGTLTAPARQAEKARAPFETSVHNLPGSTRGTAKLIWRVCGIEHPAGGESERKLRLTCVCVS